jgi:hypothetical protein
MNILLLSRFVCLKEGKVFKSGEGKVEMVKGQAWRGTA